MFRYCSSRTYVEGTIELYLGTEFYECCVEEDGFGDIRNIIQYLEEKQYLNVPSYVCEEIINDAELELSLEEFEKGAKQSWAKHYEEIKPLIALAKRVITN